MLHFRISRKRNRVAAVLPRRQRGKHVAKIEEISFDFAAREDYLTGFHKRKLQRVRVAQEDAAKKAKEAKLTARRILRDGRKTDLERHVNEVNSLLGNVQDEMLPSTTDRAEGQESPMEELQEIVDINHEEDYLDDERQTTVTIEVVDVAKNGLRHIPNKIDESIEDQRRVDSELEAQPMVFGHADHEPKRVWSKEKLAGPKKKKKKFKYETKAARKVTRSQEKSRNRLKAKARKE